jgi:hypothetical protein
VNIQDLGRTIPSLSEKPHADKIKLFGWYLHAHRRKQHFQPADIGKCYEALHLVLPSSFGGYFQQLVNQKALLKSSSGYRLESKVREGLEARHGGQEVTVQVTELLRTLPEKIPDLAERTYLNEALICYKHGAARAALVMTWNLAYHHLCDHVLSKHLANFNARWLISFPNHHKKPKAIASMDDFNRELKESEVIRICKDANIITPDVFRILDEKLGRRNSAAHPSSVQIGKIQVDAFIEDLITNVVLKLA